jgi:alpha-L-fucosidase
MHRLNPVHLCALITLNLTIAFLPLQAQDAKLLNPLQESDAAFEERMAWFNEARFGMFIHWGAYSVLEGEWQGKPARGYAEWIQSKATIPRDAYREVAARFQPDKFDADAWIRTARDAGMKYFVITTKHHDGFCLWDSAHTDYDIVDHAGLDFDPLAQLSEACKKHGVRFGTYYSILDWADAANHSRVAKPADKEAYVRYMKDQVRELIEKYDTDILWFDGDWVDWWTLEDGADFYSYIRGLKPSIIINNRVSKRQKFKRDFGTPEQVTPGGDLGYDWEACWTINHSWGFKRADTKWKSTGQLIEKLSDIVSKGGNLLLNVGPRPDGTFPDGNTEQLLEMGKWLEVNGAAIYGTDSSKIPQPSWGRLTQKDKTLYLHVFEWPKDGQLVLDKLATPATTASLLGHAEEQALQIQTARNRVAISLPAQAPASPVPVIRLDFNAEITASVDQGDQPDLGEGDILLSARDAQITGKGPLALEEGQKNLGYWQSNDNTASWTFQNVSPDTLYAVELDYSLDPAYAGGHFRLDCGGSWCAGFVPATKNWNDYQGLHAGHIHVQDVGQATLTLKKQGGGQALLNLKAIILRRQ